MHLTYKDRCEAGRVLASAVQRYAGRPDLLVLALPRGGVPVAFEVAQALAAPLDTLVVRKLGLPGQEELALGAIASGGGVVLNEQVTDVYSLSQEVIDQVVDRETKELHRREHAYRGDRPAPPIKNKCVLLIDDGLATGSTMRAAIAAVKQHYPARLVVAVPVAPPQTVEALRQEVDDVICPAMPVVFRAVGQWYEQFDQVSDEQVRELLAKSWAKPPQAVPAGSSTP